MSEHKLTPLQIQAFARHLLLEEKSAATMEKYLRDIRAFACWLGDREICKELTAEWKAYLAEQGYAPASINAMLSALNSLLAHSVGLFPHPQTEKEGGHGHRSDSGTHGLPLLEVS